MEKHINKESLYEEMVKSVESDQLTEKAQEILLYMIKKILSIRYGNNIPKEQYDNYLEHIIVDMLNKWKSFKPGNPKYVDKGSFTYMYFSQMIKCSLASIHMRTIRKLYANKIKTKIITI